MSTLFGGHDGEAPEEEDGFVRWREPVFLKILFLSSFPSSSSFCVHLVIVLLSY